jgi:hypothetical protein
LHLAYRGDLLIVPFPRLLERSNLILSGSALPLRLRRFTKSPPS